MSRIEAYFKDIKVEGEKAFIPFLMAGDPDIGITEKLVLAAEKNGAGIIELGIPYGSSLADGPTIQKAAQRSLVHKTNLQSIFKLVKNIRKKSQFPLVLMGYYNSVYRYGVKSFVRDCEDSGVDGVIIPDLPFGSDRELREARNNLEIIMLVSPNSTEDRIKEIVTHASGFIYAVSRSGVTGTREELSSEIEEQVSLIKGLRDIPVAVGFGISKPEHVKQVHSYADGAIVGSAIVNKVEENLKLLPEREDEFVETIGEFIGYLSKE
ncbi:MAG: tryptophan synthase subunit alpha [Firmicutes bacterium]|nr:tryptophan synthase subunit alpha [Bacillota bacterium]